MRLRVARHTQNLEKVSKFYLDILSLEVLGQFVDHDGYDGIFLGLSTSDWEIELTANGKTPDHHADEDDLLVFYLSEEELSEVRSKLLEHNIPVLKPRNPYWQDKGILFSDPDGFVVLVTLKR